MNNIEDLKLSRDMKYEALYWAIGFISTKKYIYKKTIENINIDVNLLEQKAYFNDKLNNIFIVISIDEHKDFVILECLNRLLEIGYLLNEISIDNNKNIILKNICIICLEWESKNINEYKPNENKTLLIYKSRLYSGLLEYSVYKINENSSVIEYIIKYKRKIIPKKININILYNKDEFEIKGSKIIRYKGNNKKVVIPEGITELSSCLFWDNQSIEEVILPQSLISIGGDTFYNCFNLKKINIPKNVKNIGNNPFGGCINLVINNYSSHLYYKDGVMFNKDKTRLIYYSLIKEDINYEIPEGTLIVGKHAFYLATNLKYVTLPKSLIKLENNPFSGCCNLKLQVLSNFYHVENNVIYDKNYKSVIGALNSINTDKLVLKNVERICRNPSFTVVMLQKPIIY